MTTSMLVAEERYRGAWRSRRVDQNLQAVDDLPAVAAPVDFTREDARVAGRIDAALSVQGTRFGPFDTLIAAQAVVRDLTLVTHNKAGVRACRRPPDPGLGAPRVTTLRHDRPPVPATSFGDA